MKKVLSILLAILLSVACVAGVYVGVESKGFRDFTSLKEKFNKTSSTEAEEPEEPIDLSSQLEAVKTELNSVKTSLAELELEKTTLEENLATLTLEKATLSTQLETANSTKTSLEAQIVELEEKYHNAELSITRWQSEHLELTTLLEEANEEIDVLENDISTLNSQISSLEGEKTELYNQTISLSEELKSVQAELSSLYNDYRNLESSNSQLEENIVQLQTENAEMQLELDSVKSELALYSKYMYVAEISEYLTFDLTDSSSSYYLQEVEGCARINGFEMSHWTVNEILGLNLSFDTGSVTKNITYSIRNYGDGSYVKGFSETQTDTFPSEENTEPVTVEFFVAFSGFEVDYNSHYDYNYQSFLYDFDTNHLEIYLTCTSKLD